MRPGWKWMAAMSVLVLGIVVSVSGAATSGSPRDGGAGSQSQDRMRAPGPPPGKHLGALAGELGVSESALRDALEAVREDLAPAQRPRRGQRPSRAQMERRCNQFTDALAKELDKSGDEVRDAMKAAAKKDIEQAVEDGRLTRNQADRILSRIDDAACVPAFGFHGRGGPGCGGPGGRGGHGPGGERFERHMGPPGQSGPRGDSSTVVPAPMGAPA